jgi:hypothetical protein
MSSVSPNTVIALLRKQIDALNYENILLKTKVNELENKEEKTKDK